MVTADAGTPAGTDGLLDRFLARLADEDYAVGVRERLAVHALLTRLAQAGELPAGERERLLLLEPLLAKNQQEQERFAGIVTDFLREKKVTPRPGPNGGIPLPESRRGLWRRARDVLRRPATLAVSVLAVLLLVTLTVEPREAEEASPPPASAPTVDTAGPVLDAPPPPDEAPDVLEVYAPVAPALPADGGGPSLLGPLRWVLAGVSVLIAILLAVWVARRLRRSVYLQRVRTDRQVEMHVLRDPAPVSVTLEAAHVRQVSRLLRQQVAGTRQELDVPATLRATIRGGGALAPRYYSLRQTPEYLVLVDHASEHDHQSAFHELMADALRNAGVAMDVFYYDGSPEHGCWRRPTGQARPGGTGAPPPVTSFAQLASRYGGHRLLVFGDAGGALDPLGRGHAKWTRGMVAFPHRAWLTPVPLGSWGEAEAGVDQMGFLVLPAQPEALQTLAEWLSSERAVLRPFAGWPRAYPVTLRGSAAVWVARQSPPPPQVEEALLVELRTYLGAERFQWLCACAVFPALSWPLTLAIGRSVVGKGEPADAVALTQGVAALGALPWFRYGRMPDWLRESLLDRLTPAEEQRLRDLVHARLAAAIEGGSGPELVTVAIPRWFSRRKGLARDVVLAGFLEKGMPTRLAQRMPERLRRLLFRNGKALYGVRGGVVAAAGLTAALAGLLAMPGVWDAWTERLTPPDPAPDASIVATATDSTTRTLASYRVFTEHGNMVIGTSFSPDGERIVTASTDGTARVWRVDGGGPTIVLRGHRGNVYSAMFSPDGARIVTAGQDSTARVWQADGTGTPIVLRGHTGMVNSAAFSQDGQRIVTASADGTARVWRADGTGTPIVLASQAPNLWSASFSMDGTLIVTASAEGTAYVWRADGSGAPIALRGHEAEVNSATFSPNGEWVLTASEDGTARVWRVDGTTVAVLEGHSDAVWHAAYSPDGQWILTTSEDGTARTWRGSRMISVLRGHTDGIPTGAISPDGRRIVTVSHDRTARVWAGPLRLPVAILTCDISDDEAAPALQLADSLVQMTGTLRLAPTVFGLPAWDSTMLGAPPAWGEVRYAPGDPQAQAVARSIAAALPSVSGRSEWRVVGAPAPEAGVTVGMCQTSTISTDVPAADPFPPGIDTAGMYPVQDTTAAPAVDTATVVAAPAAAPVVSSADRPVEYSPQIVAAIRRSSGVRYPDGVDLPTRSANPNITAIILHTSQAPDAASVQVLKSGRPGLPGPLGHWAVLTDGTIEYIAPEAERVSHVGMASRGVRNANTIAIDATGLPAFTDARQVEALVRLVADVADRWEIPTEMILSHAEVATPAGRKMDMGQQAPAIRRMVDEIRSKHPRAEQRAAP